MFRKEVSNNAIYSKFHKKFGKINYPSQISPPIKPKKGKSRRKVVFVNPDDDHCLYWWPAIVVPETEYNLFKQSYDNSNNFKIPNENEILVCYFEDGSFSVIPESDSVPFNPTTAPYTKYLNDPNISFAFKNDKAVKLAKLYLETGELPSSFLWLKDVPSDDRDKDDKLFERNTLEDRKKKMINNPYIQKRRDKKEKDLLKKSPKFQNKPNPLVKLSNIKNTQTQEFKHNKLNEMKNQKQHTYNNGLMKHINKPNDSVISSDKNDTNLIHHNHPIKNEMNRINKSYNTTSSTLTNGNVNNNNNNNNINNFDNSNGNVNYNNGKNDLLKSNSSMMKTSNKYKNMEYDNNSTIPLNTMKSHSSSETINYDIKDDNSSSSSGIVMRPRRVSINNKEKNRKENQEINKEINKETTKEITKEMNKHMNREINGETCLINENDEVILPGFLTKPIIFKKQKLQDDPEALSIFPELRKKRLKRTFDEVNNLINQSVDTINSSKNKNIFPIPPIHI
jgi:hypothetical protein